MTASVGRHRRELDVLRRWGAVDSRTHGRAGEPDVGQGRWLVGSQSSVDESLHVGNLVDFVHKFVLARGTGELIGTSAAIRLYVVERPNPKLSV
jgi:hypothetical protein